MFSDDEIISIREICLSDKCDRKSLSFNDPLLLSDSGKNESEINRSQRSSDGFYPENENQQASFSWTEADGSLASLVSESNFCQDLDLDLDPEIKSEFKEPDTSGSPCSSSSYRSTINWTRKTPQFSSNYVSSTSGSSTTDVKPQRNRAVCRVDKADPRSRLHFVKYLKRHGRTVKLWECGICSREFQHQYTLVRHLPTHTDERNFHCDSCGKSFRQLSTLSQHRAIHSTERPYECEVCRKTFNRVSTLISHRKTHSGDKPYKCHICPKGFHQKGNLRNHLFTHTDERPYRCNICYKGFNQQSNLVCHKNKAHPDQNKHGNTPRNRSSTQTSTNTRSKVNRLAFENCEVSSTVGPNLLPTSTMDWSTNLESVLELPGTSNLDWSLSNQEWPWCPMPSGGTGNGVVVNSIPTYNMGLAMASRQTSFALLKSESGAPVLVKMVDAILPGGKQVLVPATSEVLKTKQKNIENSEFIKTQSQIANPSNIPGNTTVSNNAATNKGEVITSIDANVANLNNNGVKAQLPVPPVQPQANRGILLPTAVDESPRPRTLIPYGNHDCIPDLPPLMRAHSLTNQRYPHDLEDGLCPVPLTPPSPPSLNLMHGMDLFETMDCMPLGPQIVAVDNVEQLPLSDESDVFIGDFEESIPLSDSD